MALFGIFGYNEQTYSKNAARFNQRLEYIYSLLAEDRMTGKMGLSENAPSVGVAINTLMMKIGTYGFQKGSGKDLEGIDARIDEMLDEVERDIQDGSIDSLIYHVTLLQELVHDERRQGKAKYTAEELTAMKKLSSMIAKANKLKSERNSIYAKKREIEDQFDRLRATHDENDPIFDDLDEQYGELESRENEIKNDLSILNNAIYQDKDISRLAKRNSVTHTNVENAITGKDTTQILNSFLTKRNKVMEDMERKSDVLSDYREESRGMQGVSSGAKSSLRDKMAGRDAAAMGAAINDADAPSVGSASEEKKRSSLRNR